MGLVLLVDKPLDISSRLKSGMIMKRWKNVHRTEFYGFFCTKLRGTNTLSGSPPYFTWKVFPEKVNLYITSSQGCWFSLKRNFIMKVNYGTVHYHRNPEEKNAMQELGRSWKKNGITIILKKTALIYSVKPKKKKRNGIYYNDCKFGIQQFLVIKGTKFQLTFTMPSFTHQLPAFYLKKTSID